MKKYAINNIKPVTEGSTNHYYFTRDEKPGNIQSKNVYSVFEVRESPLPPEEYPLFAYGSKEGNKIELKKYEVDGYWTNIEVLGDPNKYHNFDRDIYKAWTCVHAYHEHATSEQFHSELKSDMKMELLPSGKFATNSLFLQLGAITFNILRLIGDMALDVDPRFHHHKHEFIQRIRLSTVIEKLCKVACQLVKHSRRLIVQFGKSFTFYRTFKFIYNNV